jgi:A118 family predicted phage portal protein
MAFENAADMKIEDNSVELRVSEHIEAINAFLSILSLQTGLTPGTLCFDRDGGIKTATEVVSENSKTYKTVKSHGNLISRCVSQLVSVIIEVGKLYGEVSPYAEFETSVRFDDGVAEDKNTRAEMSMKLVGGGLRSKYWALTKDFGLSEEEALAEIERMGGFGSLTD